MSLPPEAIAELRKIAEAQPRKATVEDLRKVLQPYLSQLPTLPQQEPKAEEKQTSETETLSLPLAMALAIEKILNELESLHAEVKDQKTRNEEVEALEKQALETLIRVLSKEERMIR